MPIKLSFIVANFAKRGQKIRSLSAAKFEPVTIVTYYQYYVSP